MNTKKIKREFYLKKLIDLEEVNVIKIVTGVRRCGKSTLLKQFKDYLSSEGVKDNQFVYINFEDLDNEVIKEYHKLNYYVLSKLIPNEINYLFIDEVQLVPNFEITINSLFIRENLDIYLTGSNAQLLSSELATLLSGRYIEINMLPFSFKEYYELKGGNISETFSMYLENGGFPESCYIDKIESRRDYLNGIFNTVLLKDIVSRKTISNVQSLEVVIRFLFDNVGSPVSSNKIANILKADKRIIAPSTIDNYIRGLKDAYIFYDVRRFDLKGKQYLKTLDKYYFVDSGFKSLLLSNGKTNIGHIIENIVYLELIRRGYRVSIGKIGDKEIDFIAEINGAISYYQVSLSILDENTRKREFAPFYLLKDSYPKYILTMDSLPMSESGIIHKNIINFLLE